MNQDELNLLHSYFDGTLSESDFSSLQVLLRENAAARRMLRDLATVDAKLQEQAASIPAAMDLTSVVRSSDRKPKRKAVALRRNTRDIRIVKPAMAVWRRPLMRWAATGVAVAMLMLAFLITGTQHGQFNVLAAVAETQQTATLPRLRQYSVVLARAESANGKNVLSPPLEQGILRSRGTDRFVFQAMGKGLLAQEVKVVAGRDDHSYWAYAPPIPYNFRTQSWPKFEEAIPDFKLRYMDLGPIIAALNADFDITDRGEETGAGTSNTTLRHLQGNLKPQHGGPIQLLEFWIDSESEIARLQVVVSVAPARSLHITFMREVVDFQGEEIFQPQHYSPLGTPDMEIESAPLLKLFNGLGR